jgi:Uma2 family endonuclease
MKTLLKRDITEYHKMIETGLLNNKNCELINGEIITVSPELPIHYHTAKRSVNYLKKLLQGKADVRFNGPVTFANS